MDFVRLRCWTLAVIVGLVAAPAHAREWIFVIDGTRFCVPEQSLLRTSATVDLPGVVRSSGFNFELRASEARSSSAGIIGGVQPGGHFAAFPRPADDTIFVTTLRSGRSLIAFESDELVVVQRSSGSAFADVWDRRTFDEWRNSGADSKIPELIASCHASGRSVTNSFDGTCSSVFRVSGTDVVFHFDYGDLRSLSSIRDKAWRNVESWICR
jgi:hypothetical protein